MHRSFDHNNGIKMKLIVKTKYIYMYTPFRVPVEPDVLYLLNIIHLQQTAAQTIHFNSEYQKITIVR